MRRRDFNLQLTRAIAATAITPWLLNSTQMKKKRLPKALSPGSTIALIAPGSSITKEKLEKAIQNLEGLGLKVIYSTGIMSQNGYLAGTDAIRLNDLHKYWKDPKVDAIWCIRGGYGCSRLLPHLDFKFIKKHPKLLIGYSDITALLVAIQQKTGLITFHGPVASSDFTAYTQAQLKATLFGAPAQQVITSAPDSTPRVITPGQTSGTLIGGNLSLISALIGTPYEAQLKNKLLFIEEVGEKPYRIDRMLTQLRQSSAIRKAAGIVLGTFADCEAQATDRSLSLMECLQDRLGDLGIPVIYGLSFGHIANQFTLPLGCEATLDTEQASLTITEAALQ